MELSQLDSLDQVAISTSDTSVKTELISIEAEIPEILYKGMKEFIGSNPQWDQYRVMSSALANFLFQSGCDDRAVTEQYLNDIFKLSDA